MACSIIFIGGLAGVYQLFTSVFWVAETWSGGVTVHQTTMLLTGEHKITI